MPRLLAPDAQVDVPVILWLGQSSDIELQQALDLKDGKNSHDAVFHSLLAAFEVETTALQSAETLFGEVEQ